MLPMLWGDATLSNFYNLTLTGLTLGSLIALIALGYTMVYGIIGLINFAHGDVFMLGAVLCWWLLEQAQVKMEELTLGGAILYVLGLLVVTMLACAALNTAINRVVYRPLRKAPKLAALVSAIGVSFILQNLGQLWAGASPQNVTPIVQRNANIFGEDASLYLSRSDLLVMVCVVPLMLGLFLLVRYTKIGKAMRAVQQNPVAAELMGIPVERVISVTFGMGGALAGAASVFYAFSIGSVKFQMGYQNGLYAFTAAVLGGIGSIPGAVLGGLLIGLVKTYASGYGSEQWSNAIIFGILILILVFRPAGLLGRNTREKV
ncbi:MAG: branched-chain amino acid ABC transporter permease [Pirellulales bacterium]|nr:branched-chain amino acid ABC transporter permease [Pirellulales bacterium]